MGFFNRIGQEQHHGQRTVHATITRLAMRVIDDLKATGPSMALDLEFVTAPTPEELPTAFAAARQMHAQAVYVVESPMFYAQRKKVATLAKDARLPAVFAASAFAQEGGLLSYGVSYADQLYRAAAYVVKILKGAKPADLPIEQPTKFELVVNLKTAKGLGITIPESILLRADEVIR
jgi:putative ABC transport system substrate-binding protein